MSGKSTYLKQVALLQLLAQVGTYVPAQYGAFRVCRQIFGRFGHNDDLARNQSAFSLEMKDMAYIMANMSTESLVIIDELGRSTANEEGMAICYALCEQLIRSGAFVFFATHFLDLHELDGVYTNVEK